MNKEEFEKVFAAAAEKSGVAELARKNQFAENLEAMMCELRNKFNSLPTEQPSEDSVRKADEIAMKWMACGLPYNAIRDAVIEMALWQKEQMMKGLCYETKVYRDEEGDGIDTPIESWLSLENNEIMNLPNIGLRDGDKVKVIIVKEDEQ